MERTYEGAITLLNSRRRVGRPAMGMPNLANSDSMPSLNGTPSLRGRSSLTGMREWLQQLGYPDTALNGLNVIHVAGTKGKGSTCAFVDSFLGAYRERTGFPRRIGLYTSPHLKVVQERIQINSRPISKDTFTKYVFEVWNGLSLSDNPSQGPRYLQLLMLISVHAFIREKVDVAIYETHNGGEYDATNVFQKPAATGITTIGMDHVAQLGPSIENIAWHKAGILKYGSPAFSILQEPAVSAVLQSRATEKEATLKFVDIDPALPAAARTLNSDVQRMNSSLGLALAGAFLDEKAPRNCGSLTSHDVLKGVEQFFWPARFHQIIHGNHQWFLDGAHNELSVPKAAQWFAKTAREIQSNTAPLTRVLIFSHISDRDGAALLKCIAKALQEGGIHIRHVILSTYEERLDGSIRTDQCFQAPRKQFSLDIQKEYIEAWKTIDPVVEITVEPTIEGALNLARKIGDRDNGMQTLVTGSLFLVGGALSFLEPATPDTPPRVR